MLNVSLLVGPAATAPGGAAPPIAAALTRLADAGLLAWRAVLPPTEPTLRQHLQANPCDVLHIVAEASVRAASYASLTLADAQGGPRSVNAQALAQVVSRAVPRLGLVMLSLPGAAAAAMAAMLLGRGLGCVVTTVPSASATALAAGYEALARCATAAEVVAAMNRAGGGPVAVCHGDAGARILAPPATPSAAALGPAAPPISAQTPVAPSPPAHATAFADTLRSKRAAGRFDVFMCHNSADKPAVKALALRLKAERGLLPWLDEWELPPGQPWQVLLEAQIERIDSAAVFFGAAGVGPWQEQEMRGFIDEFVRRKVPLIPVILDGAPALPHLPLFLRAMTWVDFRRADPEPFERLVWGITQQRSEP